MKKPANPLRLIMFTSKDCKFCPDMERVVRKFVGSGIGSKVNVTTVDVDLNPDIAERYDIKMLPTVVMNNEPILTGYMNEDDIRDRLMNKIFQSILSRDPSFDRRKEQLFVLMRNLMDSITRKELIRPNIGDYVHLGSLQIINMSLLSLDRLAAILIYDAGKMQGLFGPGQMMITSLNPKIHQELRAGPRFREIINGLISYLSNNEEFPLYIAEKAEILEVNEETATIRVYGSALAVSSPEINEPLCWSLAGEMAGQIQAISGRIAKVSEIACWGLGHKHCDFFIEILDEEISLAITSDKGKSEIQERRAIFQNTILEMADVFQQSLFIKKRIRSINGDFVHISVVQHIFTALKLMDPFLGMILYSAGSIYGLTGPGKNIIQQHIVNEGLSHPLTLKKAVELVVKELTHPTTLLSREHSFVEYEIDEDEESASVLLNENAYSAGSANVGEKFCDFTAGFLNGRLQLLVGEEIIVKETACFGSGDKKCKFKISIV